MKSPFFVNSFISLVFFTLLCASNQYSFYWIYAKSLFYKFIDMRYSVIIPVYNRPDEVDELLQSLTVQCFKDFEVVIVEDGSSIPCKEVADRYTDRLDIKYFSKPNSGPGQTRNYGAERSEGEYFIILDSDVILPEGYFDAIEKELQASPADAFGGPDRAHDSFTDIQKAINYSMTSFFTTGGIRGGKKKMDKFYPRSFNMGIRREVYEALGGFSKMRFGEDIDFSIRIFKGGYTCRLFPDAWVYHKRRTDLKKFFKQVHNSGIARINLYKKYPDSLKLVHLLPAGSLFAFITDSFGVGARFVSFLSTIFQNGSRVCDRRDGTSVFRICRHVGSTSSLTALFLGGLRGFDNQKSQFMDWNAVNYCFLYTTNWLWNGILACMVAALCQRKR